MKILRKRKFQFWKVLVTPHLNHLLEKAVTQDAHVTKSDFIRCAVREKLSVMGLKKELETLEKGV